MDDAVVVDGVVRSFGEKRAVDGASFAVRRGEVFGLLGHNGAGKTTLIRLINGLLPPDTGRVTTLGMDPVAQGDLVRARTGVLTEYPALDDFLTPAENLAVYAAVYGVSADVGARRSHELIERLGLAEHVRQPARSLSAGLKQRLALARALIHDPELLLLDEPTSNLDPIAARGVRDLVVELSREHGRTVLLSTHNLIEAQGMCDRVGIVERGRLLAVGSLDELGQDIDQGLVEVRVAPTDTGVALDAMVDHGATEVHELVSPGAVAGRLARSSVPTLVERLVGAGVAVHAVVPQTPTLEDVYVSFHGQASRRSAPIPADLP